jgi:hypothetical protein
MMREGPLVFFAQLLQAALPLLSDKATLQLVGEPDYGKMGRRHRGESSDLWSKCVVLGWQIRGFTSKDASIR